MPLPVPLPHLGYIAFNAGEAPFDDLDVRRVAALAMNRQALAAIWRQLPTDQLLRRLSLDSALAVAFHQVGMDQRGDIDVVGACIAVLAAALLVLGPRTTRLRWLVPHEHPEDLARAPVLRERPRCRPPPPEEGTSCSAESPSDDLDAHARRAEETDMRIDHKLVLALSGLAMAALLASCGEGQTIQIEAFDELAWDPASVTVQAGETVTFVATNDGELQHEFVLGPEHVQEAHEEAAAGGMEHGEAGEKAMAVLELAPGETKEATVTFDEPGDVLYGCHEPGHYDGGMVGTVTVE
jgi:uncharacterized cupredoxin-like copper-binding protein